MASIALMKIIHMLDDSEHGIVPFRLRDLVWWVNCVERNRDDEYGHCMNRFASRWANLMEKKMAEGHKLADIIKSTHDEAAAGEDVRTGFALEALGRSWEHGEELLRLQRLRT